MGALSLLLVCIILMAAIYALSKHKNKYKVMQKQVIQVGNKIHNIHNINEDYEEEIGEIYIETNQHKNEGVDDVINDINMTLQRIGNDDFDIKLFDDMEDIDVMDMDNAVELEYVE